MMKDVKQLQSKLENQFTKEVKAIDKTALELMKTDEEAATKFLTDYSVSAGNQTVKEWKQLGEYLLVKYIDGNIKKEKNGVFERNPYGYPASPDQPGYPDSWKKRVIEDTGDKLLVPGDGH